MTRLIVAAVLLVIALFALGFALRDHLFGPPQPRAASASQPPTAAGAAAPSAVAAPPAPSLTVSSLEGGVELRESAAEDWQVVTVPQDFGGSDALRTREGGSAVITGGDGVRVEISERSQLSLSRLERGVASLLLESGRIAAQVSGGRSRLQVAVQGNPTLVQSDDGAFAVQRNADGQVTVATTQGRTGLRARDRELQLTAGELSIVPVDRPPSPPSRIPPTLFLKVSRSGPGKLNRRETDLGGETTPGALVTVNGVEVSADDQGRFAARVPLHEGENSVKVTARDALGRVQQKTLAPIQVDTQAPKLEGKVVW